MEGLASEIRKSKAFNDLRKNSFLWNLVKFLVNDVIIRLAKDLLDDGKINGSSK